MLIAPPINATISMPKLRAGLAAPVCNEGELVPVAVPVVAPASLVPGLVPVGVTRAVAVMTWREPSGAVDVSRISDSTAPPPG